MISYKYVHGHFSPIHGENVYADKKAFYYESPSNGGMTNKKFYITDDDLTKCSDEEWDFFLRYGKEATIAWREHTPQEKGNFRKFIALYQTFWELYYEYYKDLCLYAIMYRNIKILKPTTTDVKSVKYFVDNANEIKGFSERIKQDNRTQVAFLYFNHRNIFTKVFSKYLDYEDIADDGCNHIYEMSVKPKSISVGFSNDIETCDVGINNLTNHDCLVILNHEEDLLAEYEKVYESTIKKQVIEEKGRAHSEEFFTSKFIPYYGMVSTKLVTYDRICNTNTKPVLNDESRDLVLSNNERVIVGSWCRRIKEKHDAVRREEKEKLEKQRQLQLEQQRREEEKRKREEEARREQFIYNQRNQHYRDAHISFNASMHQYKVDGMVLQSVTNFVEGCFPKFDIEFYAEKKATEMGVSVKSVLDMWEQKAKESRDLGTALHKRIEGYYQDITFAPNDDKAFDLFKQFANKVTLKPYRTEWAVYDLKHNIAGTIDFVDFQNGEYIIYDWKRSQKIIENGMPIKKDKYGKKGNYPLEHLDNSSYYHYALQLSLYKYILENNYGIRISDLRLGVFHPAYDKPYVLRMPYLEKEINDLFGLRSEILF